MTPNNFLCTWITEDCHKCPHPIDMNEHQLHKAILNWEKESCVNMASIVFAKKVAWTILK